MWAYGPKAAPMRCQTKDLTHSGKYFEPKNPYATSQEYIVRNYVRVALDNSNKQVLTLNYKDGDESGGFTGEYLNM